MAAITKHRQLHGAWATEINDGINGRADRAAGEKDVIDENNCLFIDVKRKFRGHEQGVVRSNAPHRHVQKNVDDATIHSRRLNLFDLSRNSFGEKLSSRSYADDGNILRALIVLDDLVSNASNRTTDLCLRREL